MRRQSGVNRSLRLQVTAVSSKQIVLVVDPVGMVTQGARVGFKIVKRVKDCGDRCFSIFGGAVNVRGTLV